MRRLQLGMTALALSLMGLFLLKFVDREGKPVTVQLAPQPSQPRVSPAEAGIDAAALEAAADFAGKHGTHALVVGRNGHIVFEKYWQDTNFETPVDTGFEPVLVALVLGTAFEDRLVHSLDEPLANYVTDLGEPQKAYTLRELLAGDHADVTAGEATDLLALALERVTKQPWQNVVAQRLWSPLGGGTLVFHHGDSKLRPAGASAGCCLRARLGDWMRVGELLLNEGIYEGNELMPPRYASLLMSPTHQDSPRGFFTRLDGGFADKVIWLEGSHKQRLWLVPGLRLTVLRIGGEPSTGWDEAMIPDSIIRGTSGWHPPVPGRDVDPKRFAPH
jgi:CubicO group peptidase (beta-lactamase class C family)